MNDQEALIPATDLRHQTGLFMAPDMAAGTYMIQSKSPQYIPPNHPELCQESIREWLTNETKTNSRQKESCVRWKTKLIHKEKIKASKTASSPTATSGAEAGETSGIVVNLKKRGPPPKTDAQYEQDIQKKEELLKQS